MVYLKELMRTKILANWTRITLKRQMSKTLTKVRNRRRKSNSLKSKSLKSSSPVSILRKILKSKYKISRKLQKNQIRRKMTFRKPILMWMTTLRILNDILLNYL
jgi:hypothetical protein